MDSNLTKILLAVVAVIAGAGIALTIRIIRNKNSNSFRSGNNVKQKNINTFGDVAGGDINKNQINTK
jgi:hypothetical protein